MVDLSATTTGPHDPPLVLLVDDDPDTCEMFGLLLTSSGFAVEQAVNAADALCMARSAVPDIVVADIALPDMDGFELCRAIKRDQRTAGIPVIAVSGYSLADRADQAQKSGFDRFLMKPCLAEDLLAAIRQTIAETRALTAASRELRAKSAALQRDTQRVIETLSDTLARIGRSSADDPPKR